MLPCVKNLRYVPQRCHFLHFEITVNGNSGVFNGQWKVRPIGPYHVSALPCQKLAQTRARIPKG